MEAETAPIPPCVQYMFRGDSRGTQELPLPGGEKALTCAMFKDAVLQANKISPVVLPPAKLSVCVTHTSDPTNSKEKKLAEHTHSPSRHTFTVREMSDDDEISQNDDDDDCTLVVSLKGTSELLDIVLLCIAQCQTLGLPQVPKIPVAVGTPLNPSDVATLAEFLAAAFGEFRAYPLWEPVNLLTGLLCAISLLTGDSLTMGVVTSSCACIKLVSRIFVFLPSMINVCENSKQLGSYTTIAELCLEIFLNTTLSRVSSWGKPQNTGEGNASSQEKPSGGSAVQIIAEEGAFDAMVYLFSLHVNDALFYKLAARLLDVIGSISCKNPKMLDTFTKSGTLLGALERILSFNYGTSEARDELFDLKMLSLKFISTEM